MHSTRLRTNEVAVALPEEGDASLFFVGKIRTPWKSRSDTPRQGSELGPLCTLEISEPWAVALKGSRRIRNLRFSIGCTSHHAISSY